MTSTEVLRTILFPFEYDDTYIPCLPSALINYLEAPFPTLVGVVVHNEPQLHELYEISSNKTMFVLLDEDEINIKLDNCIISVKEFKKLVNFKAKYPILQVIRTHRRWVQDHILSERTTTKEKVF